LPTSLFTPIRPRCASMASLQNASPKPTEWYFCSLRACVHGTKLFENFCPILLRNSGSLIPNRDHNFRGFSPDNENKRPTMRAMFEPVAHKVFDNPTVPNWDYNTRCMIVNIKSNLLIRLDRSNVFLRNSRFCLKTLDRARCFMWRDEQGGRVKEYQRYFEPRTTLDIASQGVHGDGRGF
jgi:hypothetical protein